MLKRLGRLIMAVVAVGGAALASAPAQAVPTMAPARVIVGAGVASSIEAGRCGGCVAPVPAAYHFYQPPPVGASYHPGYGYPRRHFGHYGYGNPSAWHHRSFRHHGWHRHHGYGFARHRWYGYHHRWRSHRHHGYRHHGYRHHRWHYRHHFRYRTR